MIRLAQIFSKAWWLTTGADTFVGGASTDVFNALTVKADGGAATTLSAFDSIDGGAGNDTLNIYSDGATNTAALSASATVKNVETININNSGAGFGAVDASKFVGATAVNQVASSSNVSKLAATTTAGFKGVTLSANADQAGVATTALARSVSAADTATTVTVALDGVKGDAATAAAVVQGVAVQGLNATVQNQAALSVSGAALTGVTVSGTVAQATTTTGAAAASLALKVTAGLDVQALAINTALATTLTADKTGTKALTGVDASASTGAITYTTANSSVATIKTGAGNDTVTIVTTTSNTVGAVVDALVETGAGNDKVTVNTTGTGKTTVNAGEGDDTITLTSALTTSTRIDGGAGTDKLVLSNGGTLVAGDYALIGSTVSNVEKLAFGVAVVADASKLAQFSELSFVAGTNTLTGATAAQTLIANGALTASATGYVLDSDAVLTGDQTTYAGTLNLTAQAALTPAAQAIVVNADTANVTVTAGSGTTAAAAASQAAANITTITGDVKTLSIATVNGVDNANLTSATAKADTLSVAAVTADATHLAALTTLTLSGTGSVSLDASAAVKLATIDASTLGGTLAYGASAGNVTGGLTFTGNAAVAENIKLGAGHDVITANSAYGKMDTITGFDSVKETNNGKSTTDVLKFGVLDTSSTTAAVATAATAGALAEKLVLSANATTLELAFVEAAAASGSGAATTAGKVVTFQLAGNTYLFQDASSATDQKILDNADLAIKIVGLHNFAADFDAFVA